VEAKIVAAALVMVSACGRLSFDPIAAFNDSGNSDARFGDGRDSADASNAAELPCGSSTTLTTVIFGATAPDPGNALSATATDTGIAAAWSVNGLPALAKVDIVNQTAIEAGARGIGFTQPIDGAAIAWNQGFLLVAGRRRGANMSNIARFSADLSTQDLGALSLLVQSERSIIPHPSQAIAEFAVIGVDAMTPVIANVTGVAATSFRPVSNEPSFGASIYRGPQGPFVVTEVGGNVCRLRPSNATLTLFGSDAETDLLNNCNIPRAAGSNTGAMLVATDPSIGNRQNLVTALFNATIHAARLQNPVVFANPTSQPRIVFDGTTFWMAVTVSSDVNDLTRIYYARASQPDQVIADVQLSTQHGVPPDMVVRNGAVYVTYFSNAPASDQPSSLIAYRPCAL
jgi:hypothetical protein